MKKVLTGLICMATSLSIWAGDLYMTPKGAGTKDGSSWENAFAYEAEETGLQRAWDALTPGGTLFLGGGEYAAKSLSIKDKGTSAKDTKTISGVEKGGMLPTFTGTWGKNDANKGFSVFNFQEGSCYWAVENLVIKNCRDGFNTAALGKVHHGRIENIAMESMREGVILNGGATVLHPEAGTHDILVKNCKIIHYAKRGVRIRNGCYNITVRDCVADAGGKEWSTEPFHMSYSVQGGSAGIYDHDITFINCEARNNYHDAGEGKYWNADGFCAERNCYNLNYIGCRSYDNTDGGWDDKSANPLLIGCVSMRNKKNYRFWNGEPGAVLLRCISAHAIKRGGNSNSVGLWTAGRVRIHKSSFIEPKATLNLNDYHVTPEKAKLMRLTLVDSIFTMDESDKDPQGRMIIQNSVFIPRTGKPGEAAAYAAPASVRDTDNPGTAYDSVEFGAAKGYHSSWKESDLLPEGRKLQPLITKKVQLLPAKKITVYKDKRQSGWYLSGWKGAKAKDAKGEGNGGSTCLAFHGTSNGGAVFRTKRHGAEINLASHEPADWVLRFKMKTPAGANFSGAQIRVYDLDNSIKTKDIKLPGTLNGSTTDWQDVEIKLKDFEADPNSKITAFAGFSIRPKDKGPLYIDEITLEPK